MLSYESFGSPINPTLCFLHGFLGSKKDFFPIIQDLKNHFYCIALDLPAHGSSPPSRDALPGLIRTISSFTNPFLVGYSLGGRLSLQLSKIVPLAGIFALSAHLGLQTAQEKEQRLAQDLIWCHRLQTLSPQDFLSLWYKQQVFSSLHKKPKLLQDLIQKRLYHNPEELAQILESTSLAHQPFSSHFSCPTYFAYGEYDIRYKDLYHAAIPHLPLYEIPASGHTLLQENPSAVPYLIKNFFNLNK
jgi:2-succinyl-6-hydroxy-2,4-cyclohexadiene-1-carboxylate synthase